ncbi:MAG: hypothetical protein O3B95_02915 [Chloroflexi bacterium]|nr:hypothetical protein [Chloroflexota bacterium]
MATETATIQKWFESHVDDKWGSRGIKVTVDSEEILAVVKSQATDDLPGDLGEREVASKRIARQFRKETRQSRMELAHEAQEFFERKVSWGVQVGEDSYLFTHIAVPSMTRLRINEREVLDTLVNSGVAGSRSEALAWCVRYVGKTEKEWLTEMREAFKSVEAVRQKGPSGKKS